MELLELRLAWEQYVAPRSVPDSEQTLDAVLARYREPIRHYHTATHVMWVVRHLDAFGRDHTFDLAATTAAAFYHDAIYNPERDDNEHLSASLARTQLAELGWPDERAEVTERLIEATAGHDVGGDLGQAALITADLGVLAAPPNDYREYTHQIRREYAHLDDAAWRAGRGRFIETMLARTTIFDPRIAPSDWEERSRANLADEAAMLR